MKSDKNNHSNYKQAVSWPAHPHAVRWSWVCFHYKPELNIFVKKLTSSARFIQPKLGTRKVKAASMMLTTARSKCCLVYTNMVANTTCVRHVQGPLTEDGAAVASRPICWSVWPWVQFSMAEDLDNWTQTKLGTRKGSWEVNVVSVMLTSRTDWSKRTRD